MSYELQELDFFLLKLWKLQFHLSNSLMKMVTRCRRWRQKQGKEISFFIYELYTGQQGFTNQVAMPESEHSGDSWHVTWKTHTNPIAKQDDPLQDTSKSDQHHIEGLCKQYHDSNLHQLCKKVVSFLITDLPCNVKITALSPSKVVVMIGSETSACHIKKNRGGCLLIHQDEYTIFVMAEATRSL